MLIVDCIFCVLFFLGKSFSADAVVVVVMVNFVVVKCVRFDILASLVNPTLCHCQFLCNLKGHMEKLSSSLRH